ncbi:rhomboid family intramembrane serine protease [Pedobacter sp. ASV12]|uniref:rhomboid family intramembrane serine protease n=1 Tax=Pedobacter sp. ASV12 TaxID=2795120 RepID=UPI0018EAD056|nr:rhomboid family intramembrane serine protease [Pedobacter sp. ASV12]
MAISWGYSPKTEKYIPLGDFPADKYLIIARQAIENLGWKLSHISSNGLIAYTGLSWQSYSEEISLRIESNFAVVKSECVGLQMWFNDYGKNKQNLAKFFHEFAYVEFHLKDIWEESLAQFHSFVLNQDNDYFEKAPLAVKNKIKNVLYLFWPQKGYLATPIITWLNIFYFGFTFICTVIYFRYFFAKATVVDPALVVQKLEQLLLNLGANNRKLVLNGQYWRLISYQFMHASLLHLFFNLYALLYLGLMIENKLGWRKFVFIYFFSGICGGLVSIIFHQEEILMGASGAIMGLYGAFIALLLNKAYEKNANKALLVSTLIVMILVLINGWFGRRTDNACHLGGVIAGFVSCCFLYVKPMNSSRIWARYAATCVIGLAFAAGVIGFSPRYQHEEFKKLSIEYAKNADAFNRVMTLKASLSKAEKIVFIEENGLAPSRSNLELVKKMKKLKLDKEDLFELDFKAQVAQQSYAVAQLMKKDIESENYSYRKQVNEQMNKLIIFSATARDSLRKAD